jgi:large subunit ribosomal protein L29
MELDKIRNLSDGELKLEETKAAEQLFRLRFQMKLGQTEGVKKLRGLKKDVARIQTIARERELGLYGEHPVEQSAKPAKKRAKKAAKKTAVKKAVTTVKAKTATPKAKTAKTVKSKATKSKTAKEAR